MSAVSDIYNKLRTAPVHHPASVELFDDMTLQAGDVITVKSGDTSYTVPIYGQDLHWNGSAMTTVESTGNEKREPLSALKRKEYNSNNQSYRRAKSAAKKQSDTDKWIEEFENTDLYVNQDSIWAVSGQYQVWTDPKTNVKHIQLKDGALLEVQRDGIYETVGTSKAIEEVNDEVVNVIEGSALWTQKDNITGVCGEFTVTTDADGKKKLKIANGTGLVMTRNNTEFGVYDNGNLTGGVMVTEINKQTTTKITGDKVVIGTDATSGTTINGKLSISNGILYISGNVSVGSTTTNLVQINNGAVTVPNYLQVSSSGYITFVGSGSGEYYKLSVSTLKGMIKSFEVKDNTLTLTPFYGDAVNFSKSPTVSGSWSGGKLTITASPKATNTLTEELVFANNGNPYIHPTNSKYLYIPLKIMSSKNGGDPADTGRTSDWLADASSVYSAGETAGKTAGQNAVTITKGSWSSGKITFSKSAGTASDKSVQLTAAAATWSGTTASRVIWDGTAADNQHGVSTGYTVSVDCSGKLQTKSVTANGDVVPDSGYIGLSKVTVNVSTSITVSDWSRSNFSADTTARSSKQLSIPVSVKVNGTTYSNTFTTSAVKLERYASTYYANVKCGSVTIARLYIDGFTN